MDADDLWLYDHDYGTATLQVPELPQLEKRRSKSEKKVLLDAKSKFSAV